MDGPHSLFYICSIPFFSHNTLTINGCYYNAIPLLLTYKQTDRQTYSLDLGIYDYSLIVPVSLDFRKRIPSRVPLEPADHANHLS